MKQVVRGPGERGTEDRVSACDWCVERPVSQRTPRSAPHYTLLWFGTHGFGTQSSPKIYQFENKDCRMTDTEPVLFVNLASE